jgi:hypothetical protein
MKQHGDGVDQVRVEKRSEEDKWRYRAGPQDTASQLTPFVLSGGHEDFVFQGWEEEGKDPNCQYEWAFRQERDDYLVIRWVRTFRDKVTVTRKTRFWTHPAIPVVVSLECVQEAPGRPTLRSVMWGFDFVNCRGAMMAKRVVSIDGPFSAAGETNPRYVLSEWRSADLGIKTPKDEDFVVKIPAGIPVKGLREPPPVTEASELDLTKITLDDLTDPWAALGSGSAPPRGHRPHYILGAILVLGVIVAFLLHRGKGRTTRPPDRTAS